MSKNNPEQKKIIALKRSQIKEVRFGKNKVTKWRKTQKRSNWKIKVWKKQGYEMRETQHS